MRIRLLDERSPSARPVLVVEDHDDGRAMTELLLTGAGFEVHATGTGEAAINYLLSLLSRRAPLPGIAFVDLDLQRYGPGVITGDKVLRFLADNSPSTMRVVVTGDIPSGHAWEVRRNLEAKYGPLPEPTLLLGKALSGPHGEMQPPDNGTMVRLATKFCGGSAPPAPQAAAAAAGGD